MRNLLFACLICCMNQFASGGEWNSQQCEPALDDHRFSTRIVHNEMEQWEAVKLFLRESANRYQSSSRGTITLIISTLSETQELTPIKSTLVLPDPSIFVVNLNEYSLEQTMRTWTTKAKDRSLIFVGEPKSFLGEISLTNYIETRMGPVNLILISQMGKTFPLYVHELENRLMMNDTNSMLRIFSKPVKKKTEVSSADSQNSRFRIFVMSDDVQRIDGNRFEMRLGTKRERGDTKTHGWDIFRGWIQSTPVTEMRREFEAHPGFKYLLEQVMRTHSEKNKNGFWWQALSKEDYTKLISAGIISLRFKDLASVLGQTEAKRLIELSKINKFTQKTKQSNITNDEGVNHD